ncbi:unnamed protein product [Boreogadus saida]
MGETGEDGEQKGEPRAGGPALGRGGPERPRLRGADERPQHQVLPGGGGLDNKMHHCNKSVPVSRQVDRGPLCVEDPHPEGPCSRALRDVLLVLPLHGCHIWHL